MACDILAARDALAERSKAVAQGAIPKGRGLEPHRRHSAAAQPRVGPLRYSVLLAYLVAPPPLSKACANPSTAVPVGQGRERPVSMGSVTGHVQARYLAVAKHEHASQFCRNDPVH